MCHKHSAYIQIDMLQKNVFRLPNLWWRRAFECIWDLEICWTWLMLLFGMVDSLFSMQSHKGFSMGICCFYLKKANLTVLIGNKRMAVLCSNVNNTILRKMANMCPINKKHTCTVKEVEGRSSQYCFGDMILKLSKNKYPFFIFWALNTETTPKYFQLFQSWKPREVSNFFQSIVVLQLVACGYDF